MVLLLLLLDYCMHGMVMNSNKLLLLLDYCIHGIKRLRRAAMIY